MKQLTTTSRADVQLAIARAIPAQKLRRNWRPLFFVGLPTLLALVYSLVIASSMYVSESRFAVRASEQGVEAGGKGGGLMASFGAAAAFASDSFAVRDFIQSRDALAQLNQDGYYLKLAIKGGVDPVNYLPNNPTPDQLYDFYYNNLDIRFSLTEQILTMRIYAFSPQDSHELAKRLIAIAENFVNQMNLRSRSDMLKLAEAEVTKAEDRVSRARVAINRWRVDNDNIDPTKSIELSQAVMTQLQQALSQAQAELAAAIGQLDPRSPRRRNLEDRVKALQEQIDAERQKLTGTRGSTAQIMGEYERLFVEQDFATRQLTSAHQTLEQARVATIKQNKYVVLVASPSLPQRPAYPIWYKLVFMTLIISGLLYAITSLIVRMVFEDNR